MQGRKADDNIEENRRTAGEQVQSIKIKLYFTCVWFPFPNQIPKPIPGFQDRTDHISSNFNTLQTTPQDKLSNYFSQDIPPSGISALPSSTPSPFPGAKQSPDTT